MAGCSRACWKWPSPAVAGLHSNCPHPVMRWAGLFAEEVGAVLQVRDADLPALRELGAVARARRLPAGNRLAFCGRSCRSSGSNRSNGSSRRYRDSSGGQGDIPPLAHRIAAPLGGDEPPPAMPAGQCRLRPDRSTTPLLDADDPGIIFENRFRCAARHHRCLSQSRQSAPGRDPARTGASTARVEMAAAFDRARFAAIGRTHDRPHVPAPPILPILTYSQPVAASPTVMCSAPAAAGPSRFSATNRCVKQFEAFFPSSRQARPRGVQRLPDDGPARRIDSWKRPLAHLPAQSVGTVRGRDSPWCGSRKASRLFSPAWPAAGSRSPSPTARAARALPLMQKARQARPLCSRIALRYVDNRGKVAGKYPANPNGSTEGHRRRVQRRRPGYHSHATPRSGCFRSCQNSWHPDNYGEDAPAMRLFRNARAWLD